MCLKAGEHQPLDFGAYMGLATPEDTQEAVNISLHHTIRYRLVESASSI